MKNGKEVIDKTRNNRFVEAFDYLRRNYGEITRKELAAKMGVNKDTVTRIMHAYTPVTEDAITKFQTATGCIFNLQWLRGESDIMLAIDVDKESAPKAENLHQYAPIDQSSLMNATIAAQETAIAALKRELADKEESTKREIERMEDFTKRELAAKQETIDALRSELKTKNAYIESLNRQVEELHARLASQQMKDAIGNFPFTIGAAEDINRPSAEK